MLGRPGPGRAAASFSERRLTAPQRFGPCHAFRSKACVEEVEQVPDVPGDRLLDRHSRALHCSPPAFPPRFVRHENVAGPSFTSSTSIIARKRPVATGTP